MTQKQKILIVEDDQSLLELYKKKFTVRGYDVVGADDGAKGVEEAKRCQPDAILLDIMLPVLNGFEVLKRIKKMPDVKDVPVVILSNYGEMPNITEGLLNGAVEYLIKVEHTPEEVVEVIDDAIASRESLIGKAFKESV